MNHWVDVIFGGWGDLISGVLTFMAGAWYGKWQHIRSLGRKWKCPHCSKDKQFSFRCNDSKVFNSMKVDHLMAFHLDILQAKLKEERLQKHED